MAVRKIITVPNQNLRQRSKPVKKISSKIQKLVQDLTDTAKSQKEPEGVGLSAIQIDVPQRVFVILLDNEFVAFINPEITHRSRQKFSQVLADKDRFMEGCLSIPGYFALVDRPFRVKLKWQNIKGKWQEKQFEGKQSAYVQHELDHLNGIIFVDRALKQGNRIFQLQKDKNGEEELVEVEL